MSLQTLFAAYRQSVTPLVNLCFATALGTAATAGVAAIVDQFITPWPIAIGMLCVSGFYLLLGLGYLAQHKLTAGPEEATNGLAGPHRMNLDDLVAQQEVSAEDLAPVREREMAQV